MNDLASTLRHRVTIKSRAAGKDAAGQPLTTWADVATGIAADIRVLSGLETIRAGEQSTVSRASIRIRWRTGLDAGMRVHHGATVYQVTSVQPDMVRRDRIDLACEVVNVES